MESTIGETQVAKLSAWAECRASFLVGVPLIGGGSSNPPIGYRWIICVVSAVGCYLICASDILKTRRRMRRALIGFCFCAFVVSSALLYLSGFRWSWGWWL